MTTPTGTPNWETVATAMREARETNKAVARYANEMADMTTEVIHSVSAERLRRLKRILNSFDSHKGTWKH
jgi:hypothetical protein